MPDFRQAARFNNIPVIGFIPYASATAPTSLADGLHWYDTTTETLMVYNATTAAWVPAELSAGVIVDAMVSATAAIEESKLSLATDAVAATGSRRTLGNGAQQAMPGGQTLAQIAAANPNGAAVAMNSQRLTGLADPSTTTSQDGATANWVTNQITNAVNGQVWKESVALATAAALPANTYSAGVLTATANGLLAIDGQNATLGARVLVKNEVAAANNGLYVVTNPGAAGTAYILTRSNDANTSAEVTGGMTVPVDTGGTANGGTVWLLAAAAVVLGTTALTFTQVGAPGSSYSAGTGLALAGNVFSLSTPVSIANGGTGATTAAAARGNLAAPGQYLSGAIGGSTTLTVTHNLNNQYPVVKVYDITGANPVEIQCDVTATSANAVQLAFAVAPGAGAVACVVHG